MTKKGETIDNKITFFYKNLNTIIQLNFCGIPQKFIGTFRNFILKHYVFLGEGSNFGNADFRIDIEHSKNFGILLPSNKNLVILLPVNKLSFSLVENDLLLGTSLATSMFNLETAGGWMLGHGSAIAIDKDGVMFADDGGSIGKTTLALLFACKRAKFICDEYVFVNRDLLINPSIVPVTLREDAVNFFRNWDERFTQLQLQKINLEPADFYFLSPEKLWGFPPSVRLSKIVFPHRAKKFFIKRLRRSEFSKKISFCFSAHIAKFLFPKLKKSISTGDKFINNKQIAIKRVIQRYPIILNLSKFLAEQTDGYVVGINDPFAINNLRLIVEGVYGQKYSFLRY